jgi:signal transduction histidine kinase
VLDAARELRASVRAVPYRHAYDAARLRRAHDLQRLISFSLGTAAGMLVDMAPATRAVFVAICVLLLAFTVRRLVSGSTAAPYVLAQTDHAAAGLAIAVATASPLIVIGVGLVVGSAIAATYVAPRRLAIGLTTTWLVLQSLVALALSGSSGKTAPFFYTIVLIVLLLSLALVVLIAFSVQSRQMKQALRNRESQLEALLEVTPVLLASVNRDGEITMLARAADQWSDSIAQRLSSSPEVRGSIADAQHGSRVRREVTIGDLVLFLACDQGSDGNLLLTAYDTTVQAQARDRLHEVIRSKDQFIAAVSHELRTPLSSVLGFAEIIQEMVPAGDDLHPLVTEVVNQSAEMAAIIDDLLVAARANFETIVTSPRSFDLAAETISVAAAIAGRLDAEPQYECSSPLVVYADPLRTRQIIRNLLTNADRYGGGSIMIQTREEDGSALLEVRDNGDPIPEARLDRIFEPYESSGPVRGQPAAIGLGLAVSRTLAELMGGAVTYRHDGEWSTFELRLPLLEPALRAAAL